MKSKLSFADTSIAFSYKSDQELKKSYLLFSSINNPVLSKLGANIVKFALKVKIPIKGIIRNTVFQQFCGGESINQCDATIKKLADYNIKTILDYAAEGDQDESNYNIATEEILKIMLIRILPQDSSIYRKLLRSLICQTRYQSIYD